MKKTLALLIVVAAIFSLTACGNKTTPTKESASNNEAVSVTSDDTSSESNAETAGSSDEAEWRQFLKDYEAWVDDYIEIVKKYKANPSDTSILSDYTEMTSKVVEWSEKADEIASELEDTSAALEYSKELLRIAEKLEKATS